MPGWRDLVLHQTELYINPLCEDDISCCSECSSVCSADFEPFSDDIVECNGCGCLSASSESDMETLNWNMFEPERRKKWTRVLAATLHLLAATTPDNGK